MCGRYTIASALDDLMGAFAIDQLTFDYIPRYNVAPGQLIPAIIGQEGGRRIGLLKWGLVPSWAKEEKIGSMNINAKAETAAEKPSFRNSFRRRRCLIPADGFYEWKRTGSAKHPMRIVMKSGGLFAMAGLYDTWLAPDGRKVHSCTIITTEPNDLVRDIHNRMPVIMQDEYVDLWLSRDMTNPEELQALLKPYPTERMEAYPVDTAVGNVKNDYPELLERYEYPTLF